MRSFIHRHSITQLLCCLLLFCFPACGGSAAPTSASSASGTENDEGVGPVPTRVEVLTGQRDVELQRGLATMRRATARYHRVDVARADGFVQILPCLEHPTAGGLGIPYGRLDRFDTTIDLNEPEILFYEPQKTGRLRLVGGEPVVPIALWGSEAPSLFGREFHRNEEHGLYGLHMWIWKHNPDGVLSFWNPEVSCEFDS